MENETEITMFQKFKLPIIVGGICLFVILIVVGIFVSQKKTVMQSGSPSNGTNLQNPGTYTHGAIISFVQNDNAVNVNLDSGSYTVSGVQLVIMYDPKVLTNVDIVPATFFNAPTVLLKKIDTQNGVITYILAANTNQPPYKNNATVAAITYQLISGTQTSRTKISFSKDTKITSPGVNTSILQKAVDITIPVSQP